MSADMYVVQKHGGAPSLSEAAAQLNVPVSHLDQAFGVQPVDPKTGDYVVLLKDLGHKKVQPSGGKGPYSNPKIGVYGPVQ